MSVPPDSSPWAPLSFRLILQLAGCMKRNIKPKKDKKLQHHHGKYSPEAIAFSFLLHDPPDSPQLGKLNFYTPTQVPCTSPNSVSQSVRQAPPSPAAPLHSLYRCSLWMTSFPFPRTILLFVFHILLTTQSTQILRLRHTHEDNDNFFIAFVMDHRPSHKMLLIHIWLTIISPPWLTRPCSIVVIFIDIISVREVDKLWT